MKNFQRVLIVGAGLIGTSIGLACRSKGAEVRFRDSSSENQELAQDLVGSIAPNSKEPYIPELVIIATPISEVVAELKAEFARTPHSIFMDIGGLKSNVVHEVERFSELAERFVSLHPMAGREISGPQSARGDLFEGRAVIVVPTAISQAEVLDGAIDLIQALGATPYEMTANAHDKLMAAISHMPQLVSSVLAATLIGSSADDLALSGGGLRDVTRIASSDSSLWSGLFIENKKEVVAQAKQFLEIFGNLITSIEKEEIGKVTSILELGREGRAKIPGKHGARNRDYVYLPVVINDEPGQLAKLFDECAQAKVNVEDLSIEHSPQQESGLITLALNENDALLLHAHLLNSGWRVHSPRKS